MKNLRGVIGLHPSYIRAMRHMYDYYNHIESEQEKEYLMILSARVASEMAHKPGWLEAYQRNCRGAYVR